MNTNCVCPTSKSSIVFIVQERIESVLFQSYHLDARKMKESTEEPKANTAMVETSIEKNQEGKSEENEADMKEV